MKGYNRHALFCADANLRVIVEDRNEIYVEGGRGLLVHFLDHGTELLHGRKAYADRANASATAHCKHEVRRHAGEGHARTSKRVLTAKALGEPRDDVAHAVPSQDREHVVIQAG
jgi:hypothetical protein